MPFITQKLLKIIDTESHAPKTIECLANDNSTAVNRFSGRRYIRYMHEGYSSTLMMLYEASNTPPPTIRVNARISMAC